MPEFFRPFLRRLAFPVVLAAAAACSGGPAAENARPEEAPAAMDTNPAPEPAHARQTATFGAGCFWCVEAVLEQLDGVLSVTSGYMGGATDSPTYQDVCTGETGHAEVVQVEFDPSKVSYATLLDWFFKLHDPTTLNRQGADVGTQYRSVIFTYSPEQRAAAEAAKERAAAASTRPVVTEIADAGAFHKAESYHQDYYRQNRGQPYCQAVIRPKLTKLGLDE